MSLDILNNNLEASKIQNMHKKITNIKMELLPIEDDGYHIFIKAFIYDIPIRLLVDTGASKTVFDLNRITEVFEKLGDTMDIEKSEHLSTGLGTNSMESHIVEIQSLEIGDVLLEDFEAVVLDMQHVNDSYNLLGHDGIDGVLGSDLLHQFQAVIYFNKKILKLYYSE